MADFSGINSTLTNLPHDMSNKENPGLIQMNRNNQQNKKIYNPVQVNPKIMKLLQDTENELNNINGYNDVQHEVAGVDQTNQSQYNLSGGMGQAMHYEYHSQVNTTGTVSEHNTLAKGAFHSI